MDHFDERAARLLEGPASDPYPCLTTVTLLEQAMNETTGPGAKEGLEPWEKPELRKYDLTEDEVAQLRASDDPMGLLLKLRPEIARKGEAAR